MKYSYKIDREGSGSTYVKIKVDRNISDRSLYRGSSFLEKYANKTQINLMDAINSTPGVVKGSKNDITGAGHIHLEGNAVTVRIIAQLDMAEITKQIVKKIQRRYAKGEARKRILEAEILAKIDRLNKIVS